MSTAQSTASLTGALTSLRTSTYTLSSTLSMLDTGIADLPRLSHVLSQTRHFELLPLSTLQTAQQGVIDELAPEVERLISRVEAYVERLEVRERGLRARAELQEGRLADGVRTGMGGRSGSAIAGSRQGSAGGREAKAQQQQQVMGAREELKVRQLRQKKERLSYAVERLQMQAQQTERKLRMSMAAQESRRGELDEEDEDELAR